MITSRSISGRAAYGRGEEVRPNNLTYAITANSATIDNDLAIRGYFISVKKPKYSSTWKMNVINYLNRHRLNILSDIIDILDHHEAFQCETSTRFPEFEQMILQANCDDFNQYNEVIKSIINNNAEANIEDDLAKVIEETIRFNILDLALVPSVNIDEDRVFIRSEIIKYWFDDTRLINGDPVQVIRNLAKMGLLENVNSKTRRYPFRNEPRSGVMWEPQLHSEVSPRVIGKVGTKTVGEIVV